MLKNLIVTDMTDGTWRLSFSGLVHQTDSIEIDAETANEILAIKADTVVDSK